MAKSHFALPSFAALLVLLATQTFAQTVADAQPDMKLSFSASSTALSPSASPGMSCSQTTQSLLVPREILGRARVKAKLVNLLRESLYDDAKGIVNVAREREIRKLAGKLKSGRGD